MYSEDQMLMLSGIQHYVFCARQWALIHIDQVWQDNVLTMEGSLQHNVVDDPEYRQNNGGVITVRGFRVASYALGLTGIADAVELHPATSANGIYFGKYSGYFLPFPIEYKHGSKKSIDCDILQLAAQAMCIEEMYGVAVTQGAIFYRKTNRRQAVEITEEIRRRVRNTSDMMHGLFETGKLPKAPLQAKCRNCSLIDACMPASEAQSDVQTYLNQYMYESPS